MTRGALRCVAAATVLLAACSGTGPDGSTVTSSTGSSTAPASRDPPTSARPTTAPPTTLDPTVAPYVTAVTDGLLAYFGAREISEPAA